MCFPAGLQRKVITDATRLFEDKFTLRHKFVVCFLSSSASSDHANDFLATTSFQPTVLSAVLMARHRIRLSSVGMLVSVTHVLWLNGTPYRKKLSEDANRNA